MQEVSPGPELLSKLYYVASAQRWQILEQPLNSNCLTYWSTRLPQRFPSRLGDRPLEVTRPIQSDDQK
jgi:hypothetical protein